MDELAINGGAKTRTEKFPAYNVIGQEEKEALGNVVDTGILSAYLGAWHKKFNGGEQVCALEEEWSTFFGSKHAIAVNSNTSGLIASLGAIGLSPGDEVIVPSLTFVATANAIRYTGATPVFADIIKASVASMPILDSISSATRSGSAAGRSILFITGSSSKLLSSAKYTLAMV